MIKIKRIYEMREVSDGYRVLIDRLWPRGIKKEEAQIDLWLKDIAPSSNLRQWFNHEPEKWVEFKKRYHQELNKNKNLIQDLLQKPRPLTLLYSAKDEKHNNAVALQEYLFKFMKES
jgi:uncharacterized protein YeaO (DUF488 family)